MALKDGLLSYWKLDEVSGSVAYDVHSNVDGTITDATHVTGKINNGLNFEDGDSVAFGNNYAFERTDSFSFSLWMSADNVPSGAVYLINNTSNGTNRGYEIIFDEGGYLSFIIRNSTGTGNEPAVNTSDTIDDTNWHHVVVTYNGTSQGTGMKIYLDGVQYGSTLHQTISATMVDGNILRFAKGYGTGQFWYDYTGKLDEVGVWDRALTSGETLQLYNSGSGLSYNNIEFTPVYAVLSGTNISTYGGSDGTITFYNQSGATNYEYSVNNKSSWQTGSTVTGLSAGTYNCWIRDADLVNNDYNVNSGFTLTQPAPTPLAPSGLTQVSYDFDSIGVSWVNNEDYDEGDKNVVQHFDSTWQSTDVLLTATGYTITGLSPNSSYPIRVALVDTGNTYYYSDTITGTTLAISAPTGLTATSYGLSYVVLQWANTSASEGIHVYYKQSVNSNWNIYETLSSGATTTTISGLLALTSYDFMVASYYGFYDFDSNSITVVTNQYPPSFCETLDYTLVDASCSAMDGEVIINNPDYLDLYDFFLGDSFGTNYPMYTDRFYVTAGWYALVAAPKAAYWSIYGRDVCTISWIQVNNSGTTLSLDNKSVRDSSCGTFGAGSGRIVYFCTDSGGVGDYDIYLFNESGDIVRQVNQDSISQIIFTGLPANNYYLMILNNDGANGGCRLLVGLTKMNSLNNISVAGIKKLWLTEWTNEIEYNYWTAADEDYYVSGLDSDFFTSIKIKEFVDETLTSPWYSVNVNTKGISFQQTMNKTKQGFVFMDKLTLTIPEADNQKWKELQDLLVKRYVLIFLDNNGNYWCSGYRLGAKLNAFRRENNEYILEFEAMSDTKLLTNIDKQYVINSIL